MRKITNNRKLSLLIIAFYLKVMGNIGEKRRGNFSLARWESKHAPPSEVVGSFLEGVGDRPDVAVDRTTDSARRDFFRSGGVVEKVHIPLAVCTADSLLPEMIR